MEENYVQRIPIWNQSAPSFEIMADQFSGRIPVTRIEDWRHFTDLLEHRFFNRPGTQFIYRGHRRWDWGLEPTLARVSSNKLISRELAERQLNHFRRATRGRINDANLISPDEEDELWSVGQHHGLMTPLLDWTYSPYVALFFAFAKENPPEEEDNPYRSVYILNKTFIDDDELFPTIRVFEPRKDNYGRLVNQAGLFTFSPYDSTIENTLADVLGSEDFEDDEFRTAGRTEQPEGEEVKEMSEEPRILAKYICKIYIRNEDREGCIRHLRRMNVHHASLFPDLIGAADYCNLMVAEEQREYEIQSSAGETTADLHELHLEERAGRVFNVAVEEPLYLSDSCEATVTPGIAKLTYDDVVEALREGLYDASVEPGRLEAIATRLASELEKYKVVDWQTRDSAQAKMRNFIRVVLREYGYPPSARDEALDKIFQIMLLREAGV